MVHVTGRGGLQGSSSARLALAASRFESDILLISDACSANAKSVMEVMRFPTRAGTKVRIQAVGPDAAAAAEMLAALLAS